MLNKIKTFLLIALIHSVCFCYSQQANETGDTIFIYETIDVYDTIFVYDTIHIKPRIEDINPVNSKQITILQIDSTSNYANLLIISNKQTATIPINDIILNENLKQYKSMKRLNFLGLMFFAANTMLFAQTEFGVTAGSGLWWAKANHEHSKADYSSFYSGGLNIKHNFKNNLFIKGELNYSKYRSNRSFQINWDNEVCHSLSFYDECIKSYTDPRPVVTMVDEEDYRMISNRVGDPESKIEYHTFSIPIAFGYKYRNFSPNIGLEYNYKMPKLTDIADQIFSTPDELNFKNEEYFKNSHHFGLKTGLDYTFFKCLTLSANYYMAFTNDFNYKAYSFDCEGVLHTDNIEDDHKREDALWVKDYTWKTQYCSVSLTYIINNKRKRKQKEVEEIIVPGYGKQ